MRSFVAAGQCVFVDSLVKVAIPMVVLALTWVGTTPSARADTRATVMPFIGGGKLGKVCAREVADALREDVTIVEWDGGEGPAATEYDQLHRWFDNQRRVRDGVQVDVWILGTMSRGKVVLEVYGARDGALLGLGQFRPRRGRCRLRPTVQSRLISWISRASRPRATITSTVRR